MISIVIPVKDGGQDLARCLDAINRQRAPDRVEVVVVDSGSSDRSVAVAHERGARVHEIPPEQFNHGGTRNLGAELAGGEVLVFVSQDAEPVGTDWLARLVGPLADDGVAGVYGRQLARPDAVPPERYFLDFLYGTRPRMQAARDESELSMDSVLFSNANSALRRSLWERFPFAGDIIMSEDQDWSRRVLLDGWRIAYEPEAVVRHSHPYTIGDAFRRFFDSGVSAERAYLAAESSNRALRGAALRYLRGEVGWLLRSGQARWLPYASIYELAKLVGLQLGARHRRLPLWLKLRCTANRAYWLRDRELEEGAR
ncbi:MAG TPA: glycosyltransferase [Solirubrobacterales bacterium]|nr:glycosyltransferase [Solirubrobacterales bacterium]